MKTILQALIEKRKKVKRHLENLNYLIREVAALTGEAEPEEQPYQTNEDEYWEWLANEGEDNA